jgi:uncharacterized OB-fold protein
MSDYAKFVPEGVPAWQMPYWSSVKEHQVKVQRCDDCGALRYVPKEICNRCQSLSASWAPVSGRGEIYTYTVIRRAPTPAYQEDVPYVIVHVQMEEGFRMVGAMPGIAPEQVSIGMPVEVSYEDVTPDWTLLQFAPASA